ncbi:hypothetical protein DXC31_19480 [Mediterraneibacter gnavus]|uniref:Peptidase M16 N-terminal domain-containing protein n=1 Tax=Mediterraneibacter gnavus TaxID=33038 RepID=A0A3E4UKN8_MEDGN|nr:hypothetical protein DXC31_19480 [Mediterraneibacter gnavus]
MQSFIAYKQRLIERSDWLVENNFFSKCENQITKCVFPLENLQGMNYIALTINVGSSSEDIENAGIAHFLEHVQMNFFDKNEKRYLCSAYTDFYSTTYYFDCKGYIVRVCNRYHTEYFKR